ncbi:MAG: hypothetical protein AAGF24_01985 [Cyanobacteria bacterium P01_H01_bin.121]
MAKSTHEAPAESIVMQLFPETGAVEQLPGTGNVDMILKYIGEAISHGYTIVQVMFTSKSQGVDACSDFSDAIGKALAYASRDPSTYPKAIASLGTANLKCCQGWHLLDLDEGDRDIAIQRIGAAITACKKAFEAVRFDDTFGSVDDPEA